MKSDLAHFNPSKGQTSSDILLSLVKHASTILIFNSLEVLLIQVSSTCSILSRLVDTVTVHIKFNLFHFLISSEKLNVF